MTTIYQEHLLGAPDICSNCLAVRLEGGELSAFTRNKATTELDHHPSAPPTDDQEMFCHCGCPDARTRTWSDDDVDAARFRAFAKQLVRVAQYKEISIDTKRTLGFALQRYRDGASVDAALEAGLEQGSTAATVADDPSGEALLS